MKNKILELDLSFEKADFAPAVSFFLSRDDIQNSEVFKFIREMPKGAALHTHHISLGPIPWVVSNLTYRDNLYMRLSKEKVSGIFYGLVKLNWQDLRKCEVPQLSIKRHHLE